MPDTDTAPLTASGQVLVQPELGGSPDSWGAKTNVNWTRVVEACNTLWTAVTGKLAKASNLADLADKSAARTNLGVAVGADVQAYDALLGSIAGLSFGANNFIYGTGGDTAAVGTVTAFARSLLDDADAATARATLGAAIGSDVQAYNATLASLAGASANGVSLVTAVNYATMRTNLGLAIGTNVQAYGANLTAFSALSLIADRLPYADGTGTLGLTTFTSAGRSMVGAGDAAAQKTLLSLNNVENKSSATIRAEITSSNITDKLGYTPTSITGYPGAQSPSDIKAALAITKGDILLGNVENKSSATIRGETLTALGTSKINVSSSAPSGGVDGEIWLQYTP